jgi:hypothetical protein
MARLPSPSEPNRNRRRDCPPSPVSKKIIIKAARSVSIRSHYQRKRRPTARKSIWKVCWSKSKVFCRILPINPPLFAPNSFPWKRQARKKIDGKRGQGRRILQVSSLTLPRRPPKGSFWWKNS